MTPTRAVAPRLTSVFIGDRSWPEFQNVLKSLESTTKLTVFDNLDEVVDLLTAGDGQPNLIVIATTRPAQFRAEHVHKIRRIAPLARVIAVLGSWCEGESRTGRPWPGVPRLYWHQWPLAGRREIQNLSDALASWWQLPATANRDERFLIENFDTCDPHHGLVIVVSSVVECYEALADACRYVGYQSAWHRPDRPTWTHGASAIIWDGNGLEPKDEKDLRQLSDAYPSLPLVALLNYPRIETVKRARDCGVTAVMSKPLLVADLLDALTEPILASA